MATQRNERILHSKWLLGHATLLLCSAAMVLAILADSGKLCESECAVERKESE